MSEDTVTELGRLVKTRIGKQGFLLLVFPVGEPGRWEFATSVSERAMATALREFLAHAEGRVPLEGGNA